MKAAREVRIKTVGVMRFLPLSQKNVNLLSKTMSNGSTRWFSKFFQNIQYFSKNQVYAAFNFNIYTSISVATLCVSTQNFSQTRLSTVKLTIPFRIFFTQCRICLFSLLRFSNVLMFLK